MSTKPNQISRRSSAKAPFAKANLAPFRKVFNLTIIFLVFLLMIMPLFTTFNEILTRIVESAGIYHMLSQYVVPFETRIVSLVLEPFGIEALPTSTSLLIRGANNKLTEIFLSWNCLGWQSGVLLVITLVVGLTGNNKFSSKLETILFGITGTFLINIFRISFVTVVSYYYGQLVAILVHDYLGSLFIIIWFLFFWWFSYSFILEEKNEKVVQEYKS